tara:strand:- start:996 stop:1916 length:921 start_codon:yes stop_codon:yes gene_type:complete
MIRRFLVIIFIINILNAYKVDSYNSIFNVSNNARTNALSGLHISSNDINGIFKQPINIDSYNKGDTYYSYLKYFDNLFNVYQFGICLVSNSDKNISFGIIKRGISNIPNTSNAWIFNLEGPEFDQIDYNQITSMSDIEIGFLIAYSQKINSDLSIDFKIKPLFHSINNKKAQGISFDAILVKKISKIEFIFGCEDIVSYKKWNMGTSESYNINPFFNFSLNHDRILLSTELSKNYNLKYGVDFKLYNNFYFRMGSESTFGLGVKTDAIDFNYAFINDENNSLNTLNQYSLILKLEGLKNIYKEIGI